MAQNNFQIIDPSDIRPGDEVLLNGSWHKPRHAVVSGDRLTLRFYSGGSVSGPLHHYLGRVRRAL